MCLLSFIHLLCCYIVFRLSHLILHGSNPTCALHLDLHWILLYCNDFIEDSFDKTFIDFFSISISNSPLASQKVTEKHKD